MNALTTNEQITPTEEEAMSDTQTPEAGYAAAPQPAAPATPPHVAPQPAAAVPERRQLFDPSRKSPFLAAVISVIPGLGNVYIGHYVRGFTIAATILLLGLLAAATEQSIGPLFAMAAFFVWLFNIIDAGRMAALYNHAMAGRDIMELPEDFKFPKMGGSIVGGAILLGAGLIAISNTLFGIPLDWIETWWPVFPIALGAYLFYRGIQDYQKQQVSGAATASSLEDAD
jgi:hypothetical protein